MTKNFWTELTPREIPAFVKCLEKYPLSMDDIISRYPMQYYTLRIRSPNTAYFRIQGLGYIALDPIGPHDAVIHFVRDPTSRAHKKKYLDMAKEFMIFAFSQYSINRLTLLVNDGATNPFTIAKLLGFTHEGTMKKCRLMHGKFKDVHIFGILREDP